jgi:hypothetical protein
LQKISGILPTSNRIKQVDMSDTLPLRPGVPSFGRPMGVSRGKQNQTVIVFEKNQPQIKEQNKILPLNQEQKAQIVKDISQSFFVKDRVSLTPLNPLSTESVDNPVEPSEIKNNREEDTDKLTLVKGSLLDKTI